MFKIQIYRTVSVKTAKSGRKSVLSDRVDTEDMGKAVQAVGTVLEGATDEQRATICRIVIEEFIPKEAKARKPDFG